MKLITKEIEDTLPALYTTDGIEDKIVVVKFFNPTGAGTWYGIEYDPVDRVFFGYVDLGMGGEYGYFSLNELEDLVLPWGMRIERDLYFSPTPIDQLLEEDM